jgi:hypothetical protein
MDNIIIKREDLAKLYSSQREKNQLQIIKNDICIIITEILRDNLLGKKDYSITREGYPSDHITLFISELKKIFLDLTITYKDNYIGNRRQTTFTIDWSV